MSAFTVGTCGPQRIGIVGHYGVGNLGDDTVVAILINKIRERYPNAEVLGFSLKPADTERRHGIKAFPILRPNELSFPRGEPPLSRVDLRPTLSSAQTTSEEMPHLIQTSARPEDWPL